jgi:hypothetical protein
MSVSQHAGGRRSLVIIVSGRVARRDDHAAGHQDQAK